MLEIYAIERYAFFDSLGHKFRNYRKIKVELLIFILVDNYY